MPRLTPVIPAQHTPMKMGLPPVRTNLTILVFRPMAAMARMMKNLDSSLKGWKKAEAHRRRWRES